jgi:hypothetical protein
MEENKRFKGSRVQKFKGEKKGKNLSVARFS